MPTPPTPSSSRPIAPSIHPRTTTRPLLVAVLAIAFAGPAAAVDGVLEINQTAALQGGITAADTPGFPVTLSEPGHYRLTGPLVTGPNTDAVVILGAGVFLDLNGFAISCVGLLDRACSQAGGGSARGIHAAGTTGLRIANGSVRDQPGGGILLAGAQGFQIDGVQSHDNRFFGLRVEGSSVGRISRVIANRNSSWGIEIENADLPIAIDDTTTADNTSGGLRTVISVVVPRTSVANSTFADGVSATVRAFGCWLDGYSAVCPP